MVEGLPEPLARLAPDLKVTYVNEAFCGHFTRSREELVGRSVLTLLSESEGGRLAEHLASLDHEHPVGRFESSVPAPDRTPRVRLWVNRAVRDVKGKLIEYHTLVRDQGGEAGPAGDRDAVGLEGPGGQPAKIGEKFRSVVHNSPEIIKIVDLDGTLRYASPAFGRVLGYDPEEALGTNVLDHVHPEDLPRVLEETERASRQEGTTTSKAEYRFKHRDGSWRWLESLATYLLDDPVVRGVLINARDITERKAAEGEVERPARRNELILDSAGEGLYGLDRKGLTTFVNPAAVRLTGFTSEELVRKPLHDIIHHSHSDGTPYPAEECPIYASLTDGEVHRVDDEVFWRKDGTSLPVEYTSTPILENGEITGAVVTFTDITGRRQAEAALRMSEEHFRSLVRKASDIVTLCEADGTIRYTSPALKRVLGYEPEERVGSNAFDLVHPDDISVVKEAFADVLRNPNAGVSMEVRARHRDGSWRYLEAVGTNLLNDPSVEAVVLNVRDVTERKRAEEALKEAERLYRTLVEQIPAVTYVDRADGSERPLYTSPRIEQMLGYTPEEWVGGRLWPERLHPDDRARVLAADERFEAGEGAFSEEYRLIARDGSVVWVREDAEMVPDEEGRPLYWQGVLVDITQSREAEEAMRRSERRFRSLVRNASDVIMVVGEDEKVRYVSPAVERVLGYSPDWVEGRDAFEMVHPNDVVRAREHVVRPSYGSSDAPTTMEMRLRHADGSWRHVESVTTNLLEDPAVRGVVVNSRDVTERKKYEDALKRSERNLAEAQRMASLGNWEHDHLKNENYWSDELYRILGIAPGEVEPGWEVFLGHVHPDDREDLREAHREAMRKGGRDTTEYRVVRPDGRMRVMHNRREVILGPGGDPVRTAGTVQDVTEQREADLALRKAEERFRSLVEQVPPIIYVQKSEPGKVAVYRTTYISPRVREVLGYPPGSFQENAGFWNSLIHPEDLADVVAEDARTDDTGEPFEMEYRMICADGRTVWVRDEAVLVGGEADEPLYWQGVISDVTERKSLETELERRAFHDPLTNLPNRALFADRLAGALERTRRRARRVAVLFMDLNGFKIVNDSLGHRAGDLLLVVMGRRLRRSLRPEDALARFGGDEFVVLIEDVEGPDDATRVAERIIDELKKPFTVDGQTLFATSSIGIALGDASTSTSEDLLRNADTAMYRAKEEGVGYKHYDPAMRDQVVRQLQLQNDLGRALEAEEFVVHYQPIIDLQTGLAWGVEALMRWDSPVHGLLGPAEFIATAEDNGLILPLGEMVLEAACRQTRHWQEDLHIPSLVVSVNLSAEQLRPDLVRIVEETLRRNRLGADRLSLDVTESNYRMLEDRSTLLSHLKALGVRVSLDDFGVGQSSLFHLKRLPADLLKIDGALIRGLGEDLEDTAILRMVVELAHTMGMKVIAEGVEDAAQLAQLQEMGCDLAQGFLFCGPRPAEEIGPLLKSGGLFGRAGKNTTLQNGSDDIRRVDNS